MRPGPDLEVRRRICLCDIDGRGFDQNPPAVGHRVPGVHGQVQDHLVDLTRIRQNLSDIVAQS